MDRRLAKRFFSGFGLVIVTILVLLGSCAEPLAIRDELEDKIALENKVPKPAIGLENGGPISNGGSFDMGTVVPGTPVDTEFIINNSGDAYLELNGTPVVAITGVNAADFSVIATPSTTIAPGASSSFTIEFDPSTEGSKTATVTIANNTDTTPSFSFTLTGTADAVPVPLITIKQGSTTIPDGTGSYSFASTNVGAQTDAVFQILNTGSATLLLTGSPSTVAITGTGASHFNISSSPASSIAAHGATSFTLRFKPLSTGTKNATITIANNTAGGTSSYTFAVSGTATPAPVPAMSVSQGGSGISNGSTWTFPDTIRSHTIDRTFTISNTGSATLSLGSPSVQIGGADASRFSITVNPAGSVAAGGSTTFTIRFSPLAAQSYEATVTINSNDPTYPAFSYSIEGDGTEWHGRTIVDNAAAVGQYADIAVNGSNVYISYYDSTNNNLNVIRSANSALSWYTKTVPDSSYAGYYTSIGVDGSTVYVGYSGAAPMQLLKLRVVKSTNSAGSWGAPVNVDTSGANGPSLSVDDGDGDVFLAYYAGSSAHVNQSTNGTSWSMKDFDSYSRSTSGAVAASVLNGNFFVARLYSGNLYLESNNFFNEPNPWIYGTADSSSNTFNDHVSIAQPSTNVAHIAYYDQTSANLKFVTGTRSYNGFAYIVSASMLRTVSSSGSVGTYNDIACSADGSTIYISFYDATYGDLKLAKSTNSGSTWSVQTVDSAGTVGQYSSIAIDGSTVYIAYYDASNTALKIAKSLNGGISW